MIPTILPQLRLQKIFNLSLSISRPPSTSSTLPLILIAIRIQNLILRPIQNPLSFATRTVRRTCTCIEKRVPRYPLVAAGSDAPRRRLPAVQSFGCRLARRLLSRVRAHGDVLVGGGTAATVVVAGWGCGAGASGGDAGGGTWGAGVVGGVVWWWVLGGCAGRGHGEAGVHSHTWRWTSHSHARRWSAHSHTWRWSANSHTWRWSAHSTHAWIAHRWSSHPHPHPTHSRIPDTPPHPPMRSTHPHPRTPHPTPITFRQTTRSFHAHSTHDRSFPHAHTHTPSSTLR